MAPSTDQRIPQASLREEWSVSSVQRLAWAMGRPVAAPAAAQRAAGPPTTHANGQHDALRRARRVEALRRLAADPRATAAERALAVQRLTAMSAPTYLTAC